MTEIIISMYEIKPKELKKLPKNVQVLRYDTLYSRYEILQTGLNRFPDNVRFFYFLFQEPENYFIPGEGGAE